MQEDIERRALALSVKTTKLTGHEINSAGKVTISLKTDLSCYYVSRHANSAGTYVRSVLTVTITENANMGYMYRVSSAVARSSAA
jgi:hypothetical protein